MRLAIDRRVARWLQRMRGGAAYGLAELGLLALIAWATARLIWIAVTPLGPVGDWRANTGMPPVDATLLTRFDPFGRLGGGTSGPAVVTNLSVKLFGVRVDYATGRGSAILADASGVQQSFAVGDEVAPGVRLKSVRVDGVTLDRGGTEEQVFLDQSVAAPVVGPSPAGAAAPPSSPAPAPPSAAPPARAPLADAVQATPVVRQGRVAGIVLQPRGDGGAFRAAGLEPGDVLRSINGQSVAAAQDVTGTMASLGPDATVRLEIDRGGRTVTLSTKARP